MATTQNLTYYSYYAGYFGVRSFAGRVPTNFEEYLSAQIVNILLPVSVGLWI
jgi:hypothetical protein